MNEKILKIKDAVKKPKVLIIIGFIGIGLIFLSSVLPSKTSKTEASKSLTASQYKDEITESVKSIVTSVSGDENPTVVVTLESGTRYTYADSGETDNTVTSGGTTNQNSQSNKRSYVTVKDSDGGEKALVITEIMPEIRGVAVICRGGEYEEISESIKNAVTAALNITSKRVYVSGGTEK